MDPRNERLVDGFKSYAYEPLDPGLLPPLYLAYSDHLSEPTEVFHNLIATFKEHLPIWHRYWDVRRRALGQDDIAPYDIWAPLTPNPPTTPVSS